MSSNAERLGEAVLTRRKQLGRTQADVSRHGGLSNTWQTVVENGKLVDLTPNVAKKLDKGLAWSPGSARAVWDGTGDAVPAVKGLMGDDAQWLARWLEKADLAPTTRERILAELAEDERRRGA